MSEATPAMLWDSGWLTTEADRASAPSLLFPGCDLDQFLDLLEIPCLLLFNWKLDFKTFREKKKLLGSSFISNLWEYILERAPCVCLCGIDLLP